MGVTGVGKTTVGLLLSEQLGWEFLDADNFHPDENVEKMRKGIPLTDEDRWPWLQRLHDKLREQVNSGRSTILACSALREKYREILSEAIPEVQFVLLSGEKDLIKTRLEARKGHYMNPGLLDSQFATLEPPRRSWKVDVTPDPATIAAQIRSQLQIG